MWSWMTIIIYVYLAIIIIVELIARHLLIIYIQLCCWRNMWKYSLFLLLRFILPLLLVVLLFNSVYSAGEYLYFILATAYSSKLDNTCKNSRQLINTQYSYCYIWVLIIITIIILESIITVPPVDTIGCYGGISIFYCESSRSDVLAINWLINGNSITEQDKETHGITINNDNSLSIMGLPINNGVFIGCSIVVSTPPYVETTGATFTVTDPSPIHNLTIQFNNDITWSQPSCVPINYGYHVNINNESLIVTNTTTIQYPVASCQSYTVSVTVMDTIQPQYQSETVTRTFNTGFIPGGNDSKIK